MSSEINWVIFKILIYWIYDVLSKLVLNSWNVFKNSLVGFILHMQVWNLNLATYTIVFLIKECFFFYCSATTFFGLWLLYVFYLSIVYSILQFIKNMCDVWVTSLTLSRRTSGHMTHERRREGVRIHFSERSM